MVDKEYPSINFQRLISDESCGSAVLEESCFYLQAEILNQLPSSLAQQNIHHQHQDRGTKETLISGEKHPGQARGASNRASTVPLKYLPACMQRKRELRDLRNQQRSTIGRWESWRRSQSINMRRLGEHVGGAISSLLPWSHTLHSIEGRFGAGVKAYFVFLRYLVYLNILRGLIIGGTILTPTAMYSRNNWGLQTFQGNDSLLDFFLGSGFLERSPVFYGFYSRGSLELPCFNTPLLFLLGTLSVFILSLIMVVRRTVVGYKHTWLLDNRYNIHMSFKVFCGWDFCIQDPEVAAIKLSFIRNDLKSYLEEERFQLRDAMRTLMERLRLYLLRVFLNILVMALLGGAFTLIYYATLLSMDHRNAVLLFQYLPPIFITLANFTLPHIFRWIAVFEDYSLAVQVNTTLVRSIFLKLACLGIYLFFLIKYIKNTETCWENQFGKEMYKLCMFDFLTCFFKAFFVSYPVKLLVSRHPSCWLARLLGQQYFLIPFNVLDLVYGETVSWVGLFYCPLLPYIGTAKLVAVFYIKKVGVVIQCYLSFSLMFRASSSSVLFNVMLLLGLIMAAITLGTNLHRFVPSSGCGPFAGSKTVFNVTAVCVDVLPRPAQTAVRYLTSETFFYFLILAQTVLLTSYESRRRAIAKAIERLKDMLVMTSSDKHFLLKQNTLSLRRQRKKSKSPAVAPGSEEASSTPQTLTPERPL
uniref:Transmembrane channel-like protein n=1 Tax=Esox lucius TaxID=8010 RepID=A0AAY5KXI2_ESOLU